MCFYGKSPKLDWPLKFKDKYIRDWPGNGNYFVMPVIRNFWGSPTKVWNTCWPKFERKLLATQPIIIAQCSFWCRPRALDLSFRSAPKLSSCDNYRPSLLTKLKRCWPKFESSNFGQTLVGTPKNLCFHAEYVVQIFMPVGIFGGSDQSLTKIWTFKLWSAHFNFGQQRRSIIIARW